MLVVGDREVTEDQVSVRSRTAGDLGARSVTEFVRTALDEIARKAAPPEPATA
jgi:threonyl-tRNA synthetase